MPVKSPALDNKKVAGKVCLAPEPAEHFEIFLSVLCGKVMAGPSFWILLVIRKSSHLEENRVK
jgi:hypothetical protein